MLKGTVPTLGFSGAPMCRGKGKLECCSSPNPLSQGHLLSWETWRQLRNMVASLSLWSQDPSCAAGTTVVVSFALQQSPDPMAMDGLLPEKGNSSPVVTSPQICHMPGLFWQQGSTACPLWAGGRHELRELGATRNATCHHSVPAATSHCHPRRPLPPWGGSQWCWALLGEVCFLFPSH